jgi:hypothetical protein
VTGLLMAMAGGTFGLIWFQLKKTREERLERTQRSENETKVL